MVKLKSSMGLMVSVDKRVVDATENVTLDFDGAEEDGGLVLQNNNSCC